MGAGATAALANAGADLINKPPTLEASSSRSGRYLVEIRLPEQAGPHAAASVATLFKVAGDKRSVVWRLTLPHRPRPRFALVGDEGHVVLFDEWLNVLSEYAIMVIAPAGTVTAQHGAEAVRTALGVPASALAPLARHGPWMQAAPVMSARGEVCEVKTGGRTLVVTLRDGALSAY